MGTHYIRRVIWVLVVALWITGVGFGFRSLWRYSSEPGRAAHPGPQWPPASHLDRVPGRPTLIVAAHPHCPCTRATIGELNWIMARTQGRPTVHVLFLRPQSSEPDWEKTDIWWSAAAIPGVNVQPDDGIESSLFNAQTSGQTLLYDEDGSLIFRGGITGARGHAGDNPGRAAVLQLLADPSSPAKEMPVFGCPLANPSTSSGELG